MLRATSVRPASQNDAGEPAATYGIAVLQHDDRHLRRKAVKLTNGNKVLVDLPTPVVLVSGDALVLEDGGLVVIAAADEPLYEIRAQSHAHLARIAWHIGNRHLPAMVAKDSVFILRDHVIKAMLEGLGAVINEVVGPFDPMRGTHTAHGSGHEYDTIQAPSSIA